MFDFDISKILSMSDITKNISAVFRKAKDKGEVIIFKNNKPEGIIISPSLYEKLQEYFRLLKQLKQINENLKLLQDKFGLPPEKAYNIFKEGKDGNEDYMDYASIYSMKIKTQEALDKLNDEINRN